MSASAKVTRFFDGHVDDYAAKHYGAGVRSFMSVRQVRILELVDRLELPRGAKVLDAGCGPGFLLEALAHRGFAIVGLDASPEMIRLTRQRLAGVEGDVEASLDVGSIERLPFRDASFDLVCTAGVVEYLPNDDLALSELQRVLRPSGHVIFPVTNLWSPVNYFDFAIEFIKRRRVLLAAFNAVWTRLGNGPVLPRHFQVRRHRPAALRRTLAKHGLVLEDALYFFFCPGRVRSTSSFRV